MTATDTTTGKDTIGDASKGVRNFKHSSDVENFYRFVFESNFRREAHVILKTITDKLAPKKRKKSKGRKKKQLH